MVSIGLDFGTSTIVAASQNSGVAASIPLLANGDVLFPAVVSMDGQGFRVGPMAESSRVFRSLKKQILANKSFISETFDGENVTIDVDRAIFAILKEVKTILESSGLDCSSPNSVRMGCPALWGHDQRLRLARLASEAGIGLENGTLVDEAIAAGLNWFDKAGSDHTEKSRVAVFDMGGGTLDVAILEITPAPSALDKAKVRVLSSEGSEIAGDSVDEAIASAAGVSSSEAENVKKTLGRDVVSEYISPVSKIRITKQEIDDVLDGFWTNWALILDLALRKAHLNSTKDEIWTSGHSQAAKEITTQEMARGIDTVLLVGGMSNMLTLQKYVQAFFPNAKTYFDVKPIHEASSAQIPEGVALGLASSVAIESLNVHRPFYNIFLEWGKEQLCIYPSNEPLYEKLDVIMSTHHLHRVWRLDRRYGQSLPVSGVGKIVLRSNDGAELPMDIRDVRDENGKLSWDGSSRNTIPFRFGNFNTPSINSGYEPRVIIHPKGWLEIYHGDGTMSQYVFSQWHIPSLSSNKIEIGTPAGGIFSSGDMRSWFDYYDRYVTSYSTER